ncbi:MAG: VWA domain-containing protein, partial [Clostridia bacterium]|nr:VWA domain-containing protein [Clostridia bacterium]
NLNCSLHSTFDVISWHPPECLQLSAIKSCFRCSTVTGSFNRIRDFVIVIDTSASTSGDLIQKFMQKTYNILKASENFFKQVNLYLIQADMEVQEVTYIDDLSKLEQYIAHLNLKGKGGTDFRPAFEYVNTLLEQEKFRKLKGLIYFTDGYGTFPQRKPPYDTAFVFMRDESYEPEVPPWAIKLVLEEEDLV